MYGDIYYSHLLRKNSLMLFAQLPGIYRQLFASPELLRILKSNNKAVIGTFRVNRMDNAPLLCIGQMFWTRLTAPGDLVVK